MITKMYEQPPDYMETVFRADREKYTYTKCLSFFFLKTHCIHYFFSDQSEP